MAAPQRPSSTVLSQLHAWKTPEPGLRLLNPGKTHLPAQLTFQRRSRGRSGLIIKFINKPRGYIEPGHMAVASLLGQEPAQEFALVKKMELLTRSRHFPAWIVAREMQTAPQQDMERLVGIDLAPACVKLPGMSPATSAARSGTPIPNRNTGDPLITSSERLLPGQGRGNTR